jgi:hypothetical protein
MRLEGGDFSLLMIFFLNGDYFLALVAWVSGVDGGLPVWLVVG